jgi:hydroxymethylbilane synthase
MASRRFRIGTRTSRLALIQTRIVVDALRAADPNAADHIEIVELSSNGDQDRTKSLEALGGRGIFTDGIDRAVAFGEIDLAVHSVKDLPAQLQTGITLVAALEREDPRDAFVAPNWSSIAALPKGAIMGSASVRRTAFLKRLRADVRFSLLRGNVDERVVALDTGPAQGTILAVAGLKRLGLAGHIKETLSVSHMPPDPGQGAIGITCRADDFVVRRLTSRINHPPTYAAVLAERAILTEIIGSCAYPLGALAVTNQDSLRLMAVLVKEDGSRTVTADVLGAVGRAEDVGRRAAQSLLAAAVKELAA